jgi:hypothetical protein
MRIIYKILTIIFFSLLLNNCGYTPLYKNLSDTNFSISIVEISGDREVNNFIQTNLKKYSLTEKEVNFGLIIKTKSDKVIIAKDTTGAASDYKITINSDFDITSRDINRKITISESFNMKSFTDKSEENNYENNLKINLSEIIIQKLILKLSQLK